jgi:hypothetical protein
MWCTSSERRIVVTLLRNSSVKYRLQPLMWPTKTRIRHRFCWYGSHLNLPIYVRALTARSGPEPTHYLGFTNTLRYITLGRIPLDERSVRRRKICLAKQDTVIETGIHTAAGFEPAIPASERPKTHALDCAATGICTEVYHAVTTVWVCGSSCLFVIELLLLLCINQYWTVIMTNN